jgi:hypothetical protein
MYGLFDQRGDRSGSETGIVIAFTLFTAMDVLR